MDIITELLTDLYELIIEFVQWVFNQIFGNWDYQVLFNWLPSDILAAVTFIILFLFGLALFKFIKNIIPGV